MEYKHQDFLIGVIDLFVIILPGAFLMFAALRVACGFPLKPLSHTYWTDAHTTLGTSPIMREWSRP